MKDDARIKAISILVWYYERLLARCCTRYSPISRRLRLTWTSSQNRPWGSPFFYKCPSVLNSLDCGWPYDDAIAILLRFCIAVVQFCVSLALQLLGSGLRIRCLPFHFDGTVAWGVERLPNKRGVENRESRATNRRICNNNLEAANQVHAS